MLKLRSSEKEEEARRRMEAARRLEDTVKEREREVLKRVCA